jgi:hypothetical protein
VRAKTRRHTIAIEHQGFSGREAMTGAKRPFFLHKIIPWPSPYMNGGDKSFKLRTKATLRFIAKPKHLFSLMDQSKHEPLQRHTAGESLDQRERAPLQWHPAEASWATSPPAQP